MHVFNRSSFCTKTLSAARRRCSVALAVVGLLFIGVAANAATRNVPGTYADIQTAINAANNGDTILVASGTYSASGDMNLDLGGRRLTIQSSGGSGSTIINLNASSSTPQARFVAFNQSGNTNSVLQGFTIENGYSDNGGAILVEDCTSIAISQCAFVNNTAPSSGGAIDVASNNAVTGATISQCSFSGNAAGVPSTVTGFGGAIECYNYNSFVNTVQIVNCVFNANSATYDGGAIDSEGYDTSSPKVAVINCSFANNNASGFVDSNFTGYIPAPSAGHQPGTVDCYEGTETLTNCVLFGDSSPTEDSTLNPGFTASYTDIEQSGFSGNHNFDSNPDYDTNLEEQAGSPLIGAGEATGTSVSPTGSVPTVDILGLTRHSTPDIGAFEIVAPTANGQSVTTNENTAKSITLTGTDNNIPARSLTYTVTSNPSHGSLSGTAPNLTYTPTAGYHGSDSFGFTVNNGTYDSSAATVSITVNQVIQSPTANPQTVNVSFNTAKAITLTGSDPNTPPLPLTYAVVTNPSHGSLSGFNASTGSVTYTPTAGYHGLDSFTFTVSNGTDTSSAATVTLNIAAGTPTANAQTVSVGFNTATGITLTGSDPDVPPLSLTYTVATNPSHGSLSGTAPNLTYTPTAGYHGSDNFTFTVSNGTNTSSAATVTLTVAAGMPTANAQTVGTNENTAIGITLTGSDPNSPPQPLTYIVTSNPSHGSLSGTAPNLTYTPTAGYFGPDSFQFKVNNGSQDSNTATVSISVDQVPTHLSVSAPPNATAGVPVSVTVTVLDAGNSIVSGYSDYCNLSSSDPRATLPNNFTLTNGTGTTSVTFNTAGVQSLNASSNSLSGMAFVSVGSAPTGTPRLAIGSVAVLRDGASVTVQFTLTNSGNGEADNVHLTLAKLAGISANSLPSGFTLGAGQVQSISVTFNNPPSGTQTLQLVGGYTAASTSANGSFTTTQRVTVPNAP